MKKAINVLCRISYILDLIVGIIFIVLAGYMLMVTFVGLSLEPTEDILFMSVFGSMTAFFAIWGVICFVSRSIIRNLILPRFNAAKRKDVAKNPAIWAIVLGILSAETLLVAGILMLVIPEKQLPANSNNQ